MTPSCKLNITGWQRHESGGNYLDTRRVSPLTFLQGCVNEDLQERAGRKQRSCKMPINPKGRNQRHNNDQASVEHQARNLCHPTIVFHSIRFTETQIPIQSETKMISV